MNTYYLLPVFEYEGLQKQPTLNFDQATSSVVNANGLTEEKRAEKLRDLLNSLLNQKAATKVQPDGDIEAAIRKVITELHMGKPAKGTSLEPTPATPAPKPTSKQGTSKTKTPSKETPIFSLPPGTSWKIPESDIEIESFETLQAIPESSAANRKKKQPNLAHLSEQKMRPPGEKRIRKARKNFSPQQGCGWIPHN